MKTIFNAFVMAVVGVLSFSALVSACGQKHDYTPPETPVVVIDQFVCPEGTVPTVDVPKSISECKEVTIEQPPEVEVDKPEIPVLSPVAPVVTPNMAGLVSSTPLPQPVFESFVGK